MTEIHDDPVTQSVESRFLVNELVKAHRAAKRAEHINEVFLPPIFAGESNAQFGLESIGLTSGDLIVVVQGVSRQRLKHQDGVLRRMLISRFGLDERVIDEVLADELGHSP